MLKSFVSVSTNGGPVSFPVRFAWNWACNETLFTLIASFFNTVVLQPSDSLPPPLFPSPSIGPRFPSNGSEHVVIRVVGPWLQKKSVPPASLRAHPPHSLRLAGWSWLYNIQPFRTMVLSNLTSLLGVSSERSASVYKIQFAKCLRQFPRCLFLYVADRCHRPIYQNQRSHGAGDSKLKRVSITRPLSFPIGVLQTSINLGKKHQCLCLADCYSANVPSKCKKIEQP